MRRQGRCDPRTVAREVVGLFDAAFPRLLPGIVVHFNKIASYSFSDCIALDETLVEKSSLQRAMLFEIAVAVSETLLVTDEVTDWSACLGAAAARQRRFYDARIPKNLSSIDKEIALHVGRNLHSTLHTISGEYSTELRVEPRIPGFVWIDSGVGDYSVDNVIIEVKCKSTHFTSADYRQVLLYWLLSYLGSMEGCVGVWEKAVLLNPRLNFAVDIDLEEIVGLVSGGQSPIEVAQVFSTMVSLEMEQ